MEPGVLFGLASAAAFGGGDFAGGFASRRVAAWHVAAGAQAVGLLALLAVAAIIRPPAPDAGALAFGALAGIFGGLGLAALYAGLSLGSMGLVTALSGVGSVTIPLLVGVLLLANQITPLQWLGVGSAVGAGALASGATGAGVNVRAVQLAVVAAFGLGLWFVLLDVATEAHQLWALVASRGAAAVLVGALAIFMTRGGAPARGAWPLIVTAGVLDVSGNGAFVLSAGLVPVGVAAALSGLYPIVTMLLARALLRDRLPPLAMAAVLLAVGGIVLISIG
jgi:drug/metabolite transporter (DMT)-like permease